MSPTRRTARRGELDTPATAACVLGRDGPGSTLNDWLGVDFAAHDSDGSPAAVTYLVARWLPRAGAALSLPTVRHIIDGYLLSALNCRLRFLFADQFGAPLRGDQQQRYSDDHPEQEATHTRSSPNVCEAQLASSSPLREPIPFIARGGRIQGYREWVCCQSFDR